MALRLVGVVAGLAPGVMAGMVEELMLVGMVWQLGVMAVTREFLGDRR